MRAFLRFSWLLPLLLTLVILAFQWRFLTEAGALWCDEANSATLTAACHSPVEILAASRCDSFPILWFLLLWVWTNLVGPSDFSIRLLGFCAGGLVWASLWFAAYRLMRKPPLLALLLLGFNPVFVRTICTNRAYGLGAALLVLLFVAVWQAAEAPTCRRVAFLGVVMLAAIHTVYYNALFLACLVVAASVVCLLRRQWKTAALLPILGALAGLTLAIYLPAIRHQRSYGIIGIEPDLRLIWQTVQSLLAAPLPLFRLLWDALTAMAIVLGLASVFLRGHFVAGRVLYVALTLLLGMGSYALFLEALHYGSWPRYFVVPLALAAVCLETSWSDGMAAVSEILPPPKTATSPSEGRVASLQRDGIGLPLRAGRISMIALAAFAFLPAWRGMGGRQTNMDFVARVVTAQEQPGDMVIVAPIYRGATFYRYYHGRAAWYTLPNVPTSRTGLEDVGYIAQDMKSSHSLDTLLRTAQATLRRKHRLWIVSDYNVLYPDPVLPPVPRGSFRLYPDAFEVYRIYCDQRLAGLVTSHAREVKDCSALIPTSRTRNHEENCNYLYVVSGWK